MDAPLAFAILPQPDDKSCGPTCLQAVYSHYGDDVPLAVVIDEVQHLRTGGTLAVLLGLHALRRGYQARIYTFDLPVFDPTWFVPERRDLPTLLAAQAAVKKSEKLSVATQGYTEFLELGGEILFEDLRPELLIGHLSAGDPLLTGLSATYLYHSARETGDPLREDDIRGEPQGHFVVLYGIDPEQGLVSVADPLRANPLAKAHHYEVGVQRLVCAILLGILTYDANLLVIHPHSTGPHSDAHPDRR